MQIFKYSSEIISDAHYFGNDSDPNEKRCCTDTRLGMGLVINDIKYDSNSAKVLTIPSLPTSHHPSTFHTHPPFVYIRTSTSLTGLEAGRLSRS